LKLVANACSRILIVAAVQRQPIFAPSGNPPDLSTSNHSAGVSARWRSGGGYGNLRHFRIGFA
jgi:hypothetical protein